MGVSGGDMSDRPRDVDVAGAAARLVEVAAEGEPVEVILVVRGTLRPIDGSAGTRWRMRLDGDHVLTFRAEWVVATRPIGRRASDSPGDSPGDSTAEPNGRSG
jgi:hypothetical protein